MPTFQTFEDFLAWERQQDTRPDLVDGVPVARHPASAAHHAIQDNLFLSAHRERRGGHFIPFVANLILQTGVRSGRWPDMLIIDGEQWRPGVIVAWRPVVVFEIVSPETQALDRTIKLGEYDSGTNVAHYVLVEESMPLVHVYSRGQFGGFIIEPETIRGLDGSFDLPAVGYSLGMAEIYGGLPAER